MNHPVRWSVFGMLLLVVLLMPALLLAQADTTGHTLPIDPTDPEAYELALASLVSVGLVQLIKFYWKQLQAASDPIKMIVTFVVSIVVAFLSGKVGVSLPGDPTTWMGWAYNAVAIFLTAAGLHVIGKKGIAAVKAAVA